MGIGGLLLGSRENGHVRITGTVPLPCGHSAGPSFLLTPDELVEAKEIVAMAAGPEVVGWYCSKPRGPAVLSEQMLTIFDALCPEHWQIMLLLRPSTVARSSAVIFTRNPVGRVVAGAETDLEAEPGTEAPGHDAPPVVQPPRPIADRVLEPLSSLAESPFPRLTEPPAPKLTEPPARVQLSRPLFPVQHPARSKRWLLWVLACLALAGTAGAWITRNQWMPRPDLTLAATDQDGRMLIRWNTDAVRGISSAVLSLNDGGNLHSYQLGEQELQAGAMVYDRQSPRVTATLRVGETRAIADFADPATPEPKPVELPPAPAPQKRKLRKE
jgi:hypothetical protein